MHYPVIDKWVKNNKWSEIQKGWFAIFKCSDRVGGRSDYYLCCHSNHLFEWMYFRALQIMLHATSSLMKKSSVPWRKPFPLFRAHGNIVRTWSAKLLWNCHLQNFSFFHFLSTCNIQHTIPGTTLPLRVYFALPFLFLPFCGTYLKISVTQ